MDEVTGDYCNLVSCRSKSQEHLFLLHTKDHRDVNGQLAAFYAVRDKERLKSGSSCPSQGEHGISVQDIDMSFVGHVLPVMIDRQD